MKKMMDALQNMISNIENTGVDNSNAYENAYKIKEEILDLEYDVKHVEAMIERSFSEEKIDTEYWVSEYQVATERYSKALRDASKIIVKYNKNCIG